MSVNKRFLLCTFLIVLIFISGCVNSEKADENVVIGIKDDNGTYVQDEDYIKIPTYAEQVNPVENADTFDEGIDNTEENASPSDSTDTSDEKQESNEAIETPDAIGDIEQEILKINGLVRVQDIDPNIIVELRYATDNNFTGKKVYPNDVCVLQEATALKLANANREFMEMGYRIKVWDAYRPVYVQRIFWEIVPDSRYVANPDKGGSKHNRGTAVDVTLVDMEGNELEMPSGFDDFTGKGSRGNKNMSENARKNMDLLTDVMVRNGFTVISTEWWHFNDSDSDNYNIIDVNLEQFLQNNVTGGVQDDTAQLCFSALSKKDIAGESKQIIFVCADSLETSKAEVYTFEKYNDQWKMAFEPMKAVIGSAGFSYNKVEGDKKTPIGTFPIYRCFGRQENPGTKLLYTEFSKGDYWVDDKNSLYYNTYQKGPADGRWNSAEDLYDIGDPYKYFIVIEYNTENPVAGKGSAIFMHVWKGEDSPTSGCTAVSEENLLKIMNWLDPSLKPLILQYPAEYIQKLVT